LRKGGDDVFVTSIQDTLSPFRTEPEHKAAGEMHRLGTRSILLGLNGTRIETKVGIQSSK
jgi:hypothetical protein